MNDIFPRAAWPPVRPDGSPWPRISVVTPSFNQGQFVEETMRSILLQGYPNLEYIVIDGGSTDASPGIIEKYADQLHYWVSEKDAGHGNALNKGFAQSTGEIMCWLNSDDMYLPWTFRIVAEIFSTFPEVNWIVGFNAWWSAHSALTTAMRVPKNIYNYLLGDTNWIQQESVFWRRSLWDRAGGRINENYRLMVDGDLWSRFFLQDTLYIVECILSGYRVHSSNRGARHLSQCHAEMKTITREMRSRCAADVLQTADTFARVKRLKMAPGLRLLPVEKLARRVFHKAYARATHPTFRYLGGEWKLLQLPFSAN
jgi:glycosyltransferase involved in cell wall biosynthesis